MQQFIYGKSKFGKHVVDEYISMLDEPQKSVVQHVYDMALELVPAAEQAVYYGMPCLKYRGKGLVSVMVTKKSISLYPFSSLEPVITADELKGFETTTGSIHFTADHPLPDVLLHKILASRLERITQ